jgi:hypothetical protein
MASQGVVLIFRAKQAFGLQQRHDLQGEVSRTCDVQDETVDGAADKPALDFVMSNTSNGP